MNPDKYRLVTRSDFDGLVCAVLLNELNLIDDITFVHPKDMQDGKIAITDRDITTNLPYVEGAHLVFDHHESETVRNSGRRDVNHIIEAHAPSAARVVYNHDGGKAAFPKVTDEMMAAVDQADSVQYSREDILEPKGWVLLNYLMDSRTGLGRFREFRISNYALMMDLIQYCRDHTIDQILELPDVQERVALYHEHAAKAKAQLQSCKAAKLRHRDRQAGDPGSAGRRNHLGNEPFHDLCVVSADQCLHPRDVGLAKAKHRAGHWQVHPGPQQQDACGQSDAGVRWRWPCGCRHLPGTERQG